METWVGIIGNALAMRSVSRRGIPGNRETVVLRVLTIVIVCGVPAQGSNREPSAVNL